MRQSESRERLLALYERSGAHAQLAALLAEEAERSTDVAQKVAFWRRGADLYRDKLSDPASAAKLLERAAELVPDDRSVLVPLAELYILDGRLGESIPVLQRVVASFGGRRVKEVALYHRMLARAYRGVGDAERALAELDAAYKVDLTNVGVLADLGLLAFEQGDLERAQKTFRGLLLQKLDRDAPITKADVYYYLGDISRQQGRSPQGHLHARARDRRAVFPRQRAHAAGELERLSGSGIERHARYRKRRRSHLASSRGAAQRARSRTCSTATACSRRCARSAVARTRSISTWRASSTRARCCTSR